MGPFDFFLPGRRLAKQLTQLDQLSYPLLVDVRTPEEFRSGHLPGAINLPLDQLGAVPLPKGRPVFVYCHSGARSAQACSTLRAMGCQASNLGGLAGYRGPLE